MELADQPTGVSLSAAEEAAVTQARALIERRSARHSHAAVVLTTDGETFSGVNMALCSGSCAEVVALGRMLTETDAVPATIVCVAHSRGVVSPCGQCRQIMHEGWPQIRVVLDRGGRLVAVDLAELLPEP